MKNRFKKIVFFILISLFREATKLKQTLSKLVSWVKPYISNEQLYTKWKKTVLG